jgi:SAM-dependent methyltransferase
MKGTKGTISPVWSNPSFIAERRLARSLSGIFSLLDIEGTQRWIDIGCGTRPYEGFFPAGAYIGIDVPASGRPDTLKKPDVVYDGHTLPFASGVLDGILCTQVLEHVRSPDALLDECRRVLKPGASLVLSAPFVWQEHEQPYDFFRFTSFGMNEVLQRHGFEGAQSVKSSGSLETLAQLASTYLTNSVRLPIPGFGRALTLFACCPIQIIGILLQKILPDQAELFLDMVVLARKKA